MTTDTIAWPRKTRELHSHHFDSTVWNDFRFRPDDVVVATYAKSGTTWVQQIVGQLIHGGREDVDVPTLSPWLDLRIPPKEVKLQALEAQPHRRFIKTHLPVDALVFSPEAKYLYIGRDGRDVVWSMYNHHANANEEFYRLFTTIQRHAGPGRPADRPAASLHAPVLPRVARGRRIPVLVLLGKHRLLVGDPPPAERHAAAFRRHEAGPAGRGAAGGRIPRHPA